MVVIELVLGIIIGPQVLDFAEMGPTIAVLHLSASRSCSSWRATRSRSSACAAGRCGLRCYGWGLSFALALGLVAVLQATGVTARHAVRRHRASARRWARSCRSWAMRTTSTPASARSCSRPRRPGEIGPIVAISVLLLRHRRQHGTAAACWSCSSACGAGRGLRRRAVPRRRGSRAVMKRTMFRSGQFALRTAILVLVAMVYLADQFGLDIILGAFAAGFVIGLVGGPEEQDQLYVKLESIGFGFFVPIFFITTGIQFNLDAVLSAQRADPAAALPRALPAGARRSRPSCSTAVTYGRRPARLRAAVGDHAAAGGRHHRRPPCSAATWARRPRPPWSAPAWCSVLVFPPLALRSGCYNRSDERRDESRDPAGDRIHDRARGPAARRGRAVAAHAARAGRRGRGGVAAGDAGGRRRCAARAGRRRAAVRGLRRGSRALPAGAPRR